MQTKQNKVHKHHNQIHKTITLHFSNNVIHPISCNGLGQITNILYRFHSVSTAYPDSNEWLINIDVPGHQYLSVSVKESTRCHILYSMVVSNAANYIHVPVQSVYALFNGRSFAMKTDTRIDELGMYNGCCVTVFIRLLGGVLLGFVPST